MTDAQYFKKVERLLVKGLLKGLRFVYDSHEMRLVLIRDGFDFVDKGRKESGTSWHGVLTPVNEPDGTEGHVPEAVVGYIDIPLEAVIYEAESICPVCRQITALLELQTFDGMCGDCSDEL